MGKPYEGKPFKLEDEERRKRIILALRQGSPIVNACQYAGVDRTQYYRYLNRGKEEQELREAGAEPRLRYDAAVQFVADVDEAIGTGVLTDLAVISAAAKAGKWQAAAWRLERRFPEHFGVRTHTTLAGDADNPLTIGPAGYNLERLDQAQLESLERILEAAEVTDAGDTGGAS